MIGLLKPAGILVFNKDRIVEAIYWIWKVFILPFSAKNLRLGKQDYHRSKISWEGTPSKPISNNLSPINLSFISSIYKYQKEVRLRLIIIPQKPHISQKDGTKYYFSCQGMQIKEYLFQKLYTPFLLCYFGDIGVNKQEKLESLS